jgi:c-di-GMP-binding flagellar brake protein YcgR
MPGSDTGPDLALRQRLDLRIASDDGEHALRTVLEHVDAGQQRLVVAWPTEHLRLFPMRAGQHIIVELTRPDEGLYSVESVLQSASTEEPPHLVLRLTAPWQHLQRRDVHRHALDMRPSEATRFAVDGDRVPFDAVILDLSSGGMRVQSRSELTVDDELELTFGTPSGGAQLRLRVHVLRVSPPSAAVSDAWEAGCQFVESSQNEREQIVQFILAQQNAVSRAA